jgi:hypothetical protein
MFEFFVIRGIVHYLEYDRIATQIHVPTPIIASPTRGDAIPNLQVRDCHVAEFILPVLAGSGSEAEGLLAMVIVDVIASPVRGDAIPKSQVGD